MKHRLLLLLTLLCGVLSGAKGINHALEVTTSEPQANIWDWQMHYKLDAPLTVGKNYVLKVRIKGSANGTLALWPIDTASDNKNQWGVVTTCNMRQVITSPHLGKLLHGISLQNFHSTNLTLFSDNMAEASSLMMLH